MNNSTQNKVKQVITQAKNIPIAVYHLLFTNFILFVNLVCRQYSIIYLVGSFVFITLLVSLIAQIFNFSIQPSQLFTQNIKYNLQHLANKFTFLFKKLNLIKLQQNFIHSLVTILLIIYIASQINQTVEVFLIYNYIFSSIFLPNELQGILGIAKEGLSKIVQRTQYKN